MIAHPDPQDVATCTFCPKLCRVACPVADAEKRETVTPWGLMSAIHLKKKGHSALKGEGAEVLWHCLGCRRCQQHCQDHIDVPAAIQGARFEAWSQGDAPAAAKDSARRFKTHGNPYSRDLSKAVEGVISADDLEENKDAPTRLFADCTTAARDPAALSATLKVLRAAGHTIGVDKSPVSCCGAPLYHAGDLAAFTAHAKKVQRALAGAETVVVPSPGCAHLMRDIYPEVGARLEAEVKHPVEALGDGASLNLKGRASAQATVYHDPCHLARSLGQVDNPRALIEAATGAPPREPFMSGARAPCCGGGGGMPAIVPQVAADVARKAVDNLDAQPHETVITACPTCKHRLERAGAPASVRDLMEILAESL